MGLFDTQKEYAPIIEPVKGTSGSNSANVISVGSGSSRFETNIAFGSWWGADTFADAKAAIDFRGNSLFSSVTIRNENGDVLIDSNSSTQDYIQIINSKLNTDTQEILADFDFGNTDYAGAVKAGDINWNTTTGAITSGSGVAVYRGGIVGAKSGVATFTINASTGDATFAGTLSAPSGTLGTITAGTITGATIQSATSGLRTVMTSTNGYSFYNGGTLKGRILSDASAGIIYDTRGSSHFFRGSSVEYAQINNDGILLPSSHKISFSGGSVIKDEGSNLDIDRAVEIHGDVYPSSDNAYSLGGSSSRWGTGFFEDLRCDDILVNDSFSGCGSISGCAYNEVNLMTDEQVAEYKEDNGKDGKKENRRKNYTGFAMGDLLCWSSKGLKKSSFDTATCVIAVADERGMPTVLGAEKIKVIGKIARNSMLVSSPQEGYARAWTDKNNEPPRGAVIAVALQDKTDNSPSMIKAMIQKF